MLVKCKNCEHKLDPALPENEHLWGPAKDIKVSIGAITCPECKSVADFVDWIAITDPSAKVVEPPDEECL